ncbi:hypothetical protein ACFLUW_00400 [Chloroflexota bacterium]
MNTKLKVGDRVKLVKGNPFGIIGEIKAVCLATRPVDLSSNRAELKDAPSEPSFWCEADDGTTFAGFEDELELINE